MKNALIAAVVAAVVASGSAGAALKTTTRSFSSASATTCNDYLVVESAPLVGVVAQIKVSGLRAATRTAALYLASSKPSAAAEIQRLC